MASREELRPRGRCDEARPATIKVKAHLDDQSLSILAKSDDYLTSFFLGGGGKGQYTLNRLKEFSTISKVRFHGTGWLHGQKLTNCNFDPVFSKA